MLTKDLQVQQKFTDQNVQYAEEYVKFSSAARLGLGASYQAQRQSLAIQVESLHITEEWAKRLQQAAQMEKNPVKQQMLMYEWRQKNIELLQKETSATEKLNSMRVGYADALQELSLGGISSELMPEKSTGLLWQMGRRGEARGLSTVGGIGGASGLSQPQFKPSYYGMMTPGGQTGPEYYKKYQGDVEMMKYMEKRSPGTAYSLFNAPYGSVPSAGAVGSQFMTYGSDEYGMMNPNLGMGMSYGPQTGGMRSYAGINTAFGPMGGGGMPTIGGATGSAINGMGVSGDLNVSGSLIIKGSGGAGGGGTTGGGGITGGSWNPQKPIDSKTIEAYNKEIARINESEKNPLTAYYAYAKQHPELGLVGDIQKNYKNPKGRTPAMVRDLLQAQGKSESAHGELGIGSLAWESTKNIFGPNAADIRGFPGFEGVGGALGSAVKKTGSFLADVPGLIGYNPPNPGGFKSGSTINIQTTCGECMRKISTSSIDNSFRSQIGYNYNRHDAI